MKPIAIFRHTLTEGPGYLAEFLNARNIPWRLIAIDSGAVVPHSVEGFSGLIFMGGPMSVNDDLPWIPKVEALIREAVALDIPLLGHCLGGQLMSKALGGKVTRNPVKEIGWGEVSVANNQIAHNWFGDIRKFQAFHWHGETFSLPQNATHLLSSEHCQNQAWAIGKHLALQCHIEMTASMIATWCEVGSGEMAAASDSPAVQAVSEIRRQTRVALPGLNSVAKQIYERWIVGAGA